MFVDNEDDREYIRGMSPNEIKARMPLRAQQFFEDHQPLLWAWKHSLLGDREMQAKIVSGYFACMDPDKQYMLVTELASITALLSTVAFATREIKRVAAHSKGGDLKRFNIYGANFHFDCLDCGLILRALRDQANFLKHQLANNEHLDDEDAERLHIELLANNRASNNMLDQWKKLYPTLVP